VLLGIPKLPGPSRGFLSIDASERLEWQSIKQKKGGSEQPKSKGKDREDLPNLTGMEVEIICGQELESSSRDTG
jgi:hypothetical protein